MANRLKQIISDYENKYQTGFILKQNIASNILRSLNKTNSCKSKKEQPFDTLDFKKAFNSSAISHLKTLFHSYGFWR